MKSIFNYLMFIFFLFPLLGFTGKMEKNFFLELADYYSEEVVSPTINNLLEPDLAKQTHLYNDLDEDGVEDKYDFCQNSDKTFKVNRLGCRLDTDKDGIYDENDFCLDTAANLTVNFLGCEQDDDSDGVVNSKDRCLYTPIGKEVNEWGCDVNVDKDGDGILNVADNCPLTAKDTAVNRFGCERNALSIPNVLFKSGSFLVSNKQKAMLKKEITSLKILEDKDILLIIGFTDSIGSSKRNLKLSWHRAQEVKNYLVNFLGYDADRVLLMAMGEDNPLYKNDTVKNRQQNRRVEIKIIVKRKAPKGASLDIPNEMRNYNRYRIARK